MPSTLSATCPCCNTQVSGDLNEIDKVFGFRNMPGGKQITQSYCRECRKKHCGAGVKNCT
ncbi:MAG: hemagglutinin [Moritella sp.]|uniref:hypothetical protein n=1 Tax=Moritella sp. TaxID=78556 RepID=UPI0025F02F42|nr:hypothetical protein [Moritella sp.]NQZ94493.1 hemagglutinin [Moritella sp.]